VTEILATAPGRCGILGNPTDMYGGSVISCTTRERAVCRLQLTEPGAIIVENDGEHVGLTAREQLAMCGDKIDIARAALTYFDIDPARHGLLLQLSTSIPMRAGLAGSTALLAAIVGAIDSYLGLHQHSYALAETTRKVEARIMQVVCGHQDQHMAVFGGLNFMDFAGKESLEQRPSEPYATVEPLARLVPKPPLLLAHTGIQHHSGTVHRSPRERWLAGESLVRESYTRIAELARIGKRALIDGDWEQLSVLMAENHALVAQLGGSGPANERLIAAARDAGAWEAKLAGAGGGGTILALTDEPDRIAAALTAAGAERILFPGPEPGLTITRR
jgi:galactokinase/mevalonate kinase-like predicted kinase